MKEDATYSEIKKQYDDALNTSELLAKQLDSLKKKKRERENFSNELVKFKEEQLKIIYQSPDFLPNRVTDFFLIASHGRFPELNEECGGIVFDKGDKLFFQIPEGVRLFFPTPGQGCSALANTRVEKRLWEMLAAKKSSIFLNRSKKNRQQEIL